MKTNTKIYTAEFVKAELADIYQIALSNLSLVILGEIFEKKKYSLQRLSEWAKEYKDNEEISESIKKIKELFCNRVNVGGLKGKLNATMCIFNLKNNYGWRDDRYLVGDDKTPIFVQINQKSPNPNEEETNITKDNTTGTANTEECETD